MLRDFCIQLFLEYIHICIEYIPYGFHKALEF